MHRVRRSRFAVVRIADRQEIDWMAAALGLDAATTEPHLFGVSPLTGSSHELEQADWELLCRLPDVRWEELSTLESEGWRPERVMALVRRGLAVADPPPDDEARALRVRENLLEQDGWEANAALYHFMGRWEGVDVRGEDGGPASDESREAQRQTLVRSMMEEVGRIRARYGDPPVAVRPPPTGEPIELPTPVGGTALFDLLHKRRTIRQFTDRPLTGSDLSTLLFHVFGSTGQRETPVGPLLLKTSPSGGSLHPVEVYPLLLHVDGFAPGIYHYDVAAHSLVRLEALARGVAADLAQSFAAGQPYAGSVAALFVLTARFSRTFWKYRRHAKAYRVVLMDAGHLSQTFYLVATELGLGAFVTAAINEVDIERRLGLSDGTEGALAVLGCGHVAPSR